MWTLVLFVAVLCCGSEGSGISCKNEAGADVDWFILYKLPDSFDYYYIDSATKKGKQSTKPINHQDGVLAKTLAPYFNLKPGTGGIGYIAYNDQSPTCDALKEYGHSKGFVMMDKTSGIWLLHSTPRFPYKRESNSFYPDSGEKYGQTFICVTFPYAKFKDLGEHLLDINIYSFDYSLPPRPEFHDELYKAADVFRKPKVPTTLFRNLQSKSGEAFRIFVQDQNKGEEEEEECKQRRCSEEEEEEDQSAAGAGGGGEEEQKGAGDLYVTIGKNIGPVDAQTWCSKESHDADVENVKCISVDGKRKWRPSKDHSKWCVSRDNDWTCFADLNRDQNRRGGALCINNKEVKKIFKSFIKKKEFCPRKRPHPP